MGASGACAEAYWETWPTRSLSCFADDDQWLGRLSIRWWTVDMTHRPSWSIAVTSLSTSIRYELDYRFTKVCGQ